MRLFIPRLILLLVLGTTNAMAYYYATEGCDDLKTYIYNDTNKDLDVDLGEMEISSAENYIERIAPGKFVYLANANLSGNYKIETLKWYKTYETRSYLLIYSNKQLISYIAAKKETTYNQQPAAVEVFTPSNVESKQPTISTEAAKSFDVRTSIDNGVCGPQLSAKAGYWVVVIRDISKKDHPIVYPSLENAETAIHFVDFLNEYDHRGTQFDMPSNG